MFSILQFLIQQDKRYVYYIIILYSGEGNYWKLGAV